MRTCIIMADTETSKKMLHPKTDADNHNHICAWSIAFRAYGMNVAVLWGKKAKRLSQDAAEGPGIHWM